MTCGEALAWLYSTQQFGIKLGLENTERLLESLGDPHLGQKILHVAGTNGKGSVCAFLDHALRAAGFRTGLYTSPHLVDFRERIRVDGEMIAESETAAGLSRIRSLTSHWPHCPTFFEIATALALDHFAQRDCEWIVLETGMGGRLDATNAVEPVVSVLTPIGFDHTEWLGNTLELIAGEKAGIIKPGIPAVSAPQPAEAAAVFQARAAQVGASLEFVAEPWPGPVGLAGSHQKWNAALAALALAKAGVACQPAAFESVQWPGRFQFLAPGFVVDGAHNAHATARLVETWREQMGGQKAVVLFGALREKDFPEMLAQLDSVASEFWFVPVQSTRAEDARSFPPLTRIRSRTWESLHEALAAARELNQPVLCTGSLFLAGEILAAWQKNL